jgi:cytochrome c-type biogenesis protein
VSQPLSGVHLAAPAVGGYALALAWATGMAAAFNPCGIGLLPAYVGFLLGRSAPRGWWPAARDGLLVGVAMTAGLLAVFSLVAALFSAVAAALGSTLRPLGMGVGAALALWGLLLLYNPSRFAWVPVIPVPQTPSLRGLAGAVVYGVVFAVASLGCAFPLFLAMLAQASLAGGAFAAALAVAAYALGMGVVLSLVAVVSRLARGAAQRWSLAGARIMGRFLGLPVLASGVLLLWYWLGPA